MEITREYLEEEIAKVRHHGTVAANIVQQALGAEMALRSLIATLETHSEGPAPSETSED